MSDFYQSGIGYGLTVEQCDEIALFKLGRIGGVAYGYALTGTPPDLPGGWGAKWINRRGMGNHGTLVLVGNTPRTRGLLRQGRILRLTHEHGLTVSQAEAWLKTNASHQYELMRLAHHLAKPGIAKAVAAASTYHSRTAWEAAWGYPVPEEIKSLSMPRIWALAEIAAAVLAAK